MCWEDIAIRICRLEGAATTSRLSHSDALNPRYPSIATEA